MILFISDMHFGRGAPAAEREREASLIACLRAHERDVRGLYLVGDVFDQYIEYKHLVPKGFVRFQALLAAWADRGVPVTYLVGNHDPWHRDYFEKELGVHVAAEAVTEPLLGHRVYVAHGDDPDPASPLYNRLRPWLRHPLPVWLYRTLLPGDSGFALARWVNRNMHNEAVKPALVQGLRRRARRLLREGAADLVVMGHSHYPELITWPEGPYLNTGAWYEHCTFGRLDPDGLHLLRWDGKRAVELKTPTPV